MRKTNPFLLLETILAYGGQTIHGAAIASQEDLKPFINLGILVATGHVTEVLCGECDAFHQARIIGTGQGLVAICDRTGFEVETHGELVAFRVQTDALIDILAEGLDIQRRWAKPRANPIIWSVGSFCFRNCEIGVYYMQGAADLERFNDTMAWLRSEPRKEAVAVLTSDKRNLSQLALPRPGHFVRLADCLRAGKHDSPTLDRELLARYVLPSDLLAPPRPGRQARKLELAAQLILFLDESGALQKMGSARARHRALLSAAKAREGNHVTLSREPCDRAWAAYMAQV
jgi:hypothetical protein